MVATQYLRELNSETEQKKHKYRQYERWIAKRNALDKMYNEVKQWR